MNVEYVLLDADHRGDFVSVFPGSIGDEDDRVSLGAANAAGDVLSAISVALLDYEYEIQWLYVAPSVRRSGIATGLVDEIIQMIWETGERYPLTAQFESTSESEGLHAFFLSQEDFDVSYSHHRYYVTAKEVRSCARLHPERSAGPESSLFFQEPLEWQMRALQLLREEHHYSVEDYRAWREACVYELCRSIRAGEELLGLIIMQYTDDWRIELSFLYSKDPNGLLRLLVTVARDLERLYPEIDLTFEAVEGEAERLADRLFPDARRVDIYEAQW